VDFLTLAGHKFYAPKGSGATIVRRPAVPTPGLPYALAPELLPLLVGASSQEHGLRPGTENVPYAVAMGEAARIVADLDQEAAAEGALPRYVTELAGRRQGLGAALQAECSRLGLPCPVVHFRPADTDSATCELDALPNTLFVAFPGALAAAVVQLLSDSVAISAGAACHSSPLLQSAPAASAARDPVTDTAPVSKDSFTARDHQLMAAINRHGAADVVSLAWVMRAFQEDALAAGAAVPISVQNAVDAVACRAVIGSKPSHVLLATGVRDVAAGNGAIPYHLALATVRISVGRFTSMDDITLGAQRIVRFGVKPVYDVTHRSLLAIK
jgi:cysteine sulfinate desulfinase/cysteine desulfurase-like protein